MEQKPIIALDFPTKLAAEKFLSHFQKEKLCVKVGMELFYKEGFLLIEWLKQNGHGIFLDLKLYDIPNTVYSAMKVLAGLGVEMVNVHAAGGSKMMEYALKGLEEGKPNGKERPKLIAVTQLTSTSESSMQSEQLINASLIESVLHYTKLAHGIGLDGVVCSALEANKIAKTTDESFLRVTPGIRMIGDLAHDQKRVVTPKQAKEIGATHIVVGRSITHAADPYTAYLKVKSEWELK